MFGLGIPELIVIFVIALVVFGPKKLPDLGKSIGRAMAEFKKAQQEFQESVQAEMKEVEKTTNLQDVKKELGDIEQKAYAETDANASAGEQGDGQKALEPGQDEGKKGTTPNG